MAITIKAVNSDLASKVIESDPAFAALLKNAYYCSLMKNSPGFKNEDNQESVFLKGPSGYIEKAIELISKKGGQPYKESDQILPPTVYIAHPFTSYGNLEDNRRKNLEIAKMYTKKGILAPVSPVLCFGEIFEGNGKDVMDCCFSLLKSCSVAHFFGDWKKSKGCREEFDFCNDNEIPYCVHETEIQKWYM